MSRAGRIDHLDGIRALAIGVVLALHWVSWYTPFFHGGSIGVDVFFVLSGFIITTVLWSTPTAVAWGLTLRNFWVRRVMRLYPAVGGLVLGCLLLYAVVPWAPQSPGQVAARGGLVLVQGPSIWAATQHGSLWLPHLQPFGQTWSLAVEWYFYLLWPLVLLGARARGWTAQRVGRLCLLGGLVLYLGWLPTSTFWFYFGPVARSGELLLGAALAMRYASRGRPSAAWRHGDLAAVAAVAAIGGYAVLGADGHSPLYRLVGVPIGVAATLVLIHTGYTQPRGPVSRLLGHRWPATVGRHSYSLYLWHIVPFLLLRSTPGGIPKPVLGVLAVAAAVLLTVLSYRYLERPFLRPRSDVLRLRTDAQRPDEPPSSRPAPGTSAGADVARQ